MRSYYDYRLKRCALSLSLAMLFAGAAGAAPELDWAEGSVGRFNGIAISADGSLVFAGANDGFLYSSTDGGVSWTEVASAGKGTWGSIAMSDDGGLVAACDYGNAIRISTDHGATWRGYEGPKDWTSVAVSSDGSHLAASAHTEKVLYQPKGELHTSSDGGLTWTLRDEAGDGNMDCVGISADGSHIWVSGERLGLSYSQDGGKTWSEGSCPGGSFIDIALSPSGAHIAGCAWYGDIMTSEDWGSTWTDREAAGSRKPWRSIASSANGRFLAACAEDGEVTVSEDGGETWTAQVALGKRKWESIACSADARVVIACARDSDIFVARRSPVAAQTEITAQATAVAADSGLRVRSRPDLKGEVMGRLDKGDRLKVLERSEVKAKVEGMEAYWYRIRRLSDSLTGWVYGYYLEIEQ